MYNTRILLSTNVYNGKVFKKHRRRLKFMVKTNLFIKENGDYLTFHFKLEFSKFTNRSFICLKKI